MRQTTFETFYAHGNLNKQLFDPYKFPQTRFQGSKFRLIEWLDSSINDLKYSNALDLFSGSASVSYYFKTKGKEVTSNDLMKCCFVTAKAFIENKDKLISQSLLKNILSLPNYEDHSHFIEDFYHDFYFTDDENRWLDAIIYNINNINDKYQQAIAFWALFQASISKRPYNLFHRKNLYMRTNEVKRSFGNKTTWDKPFVDVFVKFINEANNAIFNNKRKNIALNLEAKLVNGNFDLVYLDPPYMNANGKSNDYQDFYHFLNGILDYDNWQSQINLNKKHKPLNYKKSIWQNSLAVTREFETLVSKFQDSHIVISYYSEGKPNEKELIEIISTYKNNIEIFYKDINYALKKKKSTEIIIKATN